MGNLSVNNVMDAYQTQTAKTTATETVGEPKLSDKAQKYYEHLKKKFGQYDFILVSSEEKENARANAGKYANNLRTVVLIDEEKIEKMATDEKYRKQYEGILSGATKQIEQIKAAAQDAGASLKGVVMQVNDNGTTSFFEALQKTNDAQKARIEKRIEKKKAEEKAEEKKALEQKSVSDNSSEEVFTVMADSFEGLIKKIEEYAFDKRSDSVQTEMEKQIGQNIDFTV